MGRESIAWTEEEPSGEGGKNSKSNNFLRIYLRQIGKIPLLSRDDEIEIGRLIQAAGPDRELAINALVEANLRLVVHIAKRYAACGLPLSDLVQAGNEGLMIAARKFDVTKGFKFSTYASWWIRQGVKRTISNTIRTMRVPAHKEEVLMNAHFTIAAFSARYGYKPPLEYVAEKVGIATKELLRLMQAAQVMDSLDAPRFDGGQETVGENLPDNDVPDTLESVAKSIRAACLHSTLDGGLLKDREKEVIGRRFGLFEFKESTLEEVGAEFTLTRERIRQIEARGLRRLRSSEALQQFR